MGRELDARVATVLGLDVLGEAWAWESWGGPGWFVEDSEWEGRSLQPVWLAHCVCEFYPSDEPEWDDDPVLGHYPGCLEVVASYSERIAAMEEVLDKLRETCRVDIICYKKAIRYSSSTPGDIGVAVLSMDFDTIEVNGETIPEAVCLAFLAAMGK